MEIQFDPFSFIVAVGAVIVAIRANSTAKRANELTKSEPRRAIDQEHRDVLRQALQDALSGLTGARTKVRHGDDVLDGTPLLESAELVIERAKTRYRAGVAESRLALLGVRIQSLRINWDMLLNNQKGVLTSAASRAKFKESSNAQTIEYYDQQLQQYTRARDAQSREFATVCAEVVSYIETELGILDEEERVSLGGSSA